MVEEAGEGIPLLCLHTAGSDTRQWRSLINDPEVLEKFRVVAFDLPWHGKSSPPAGWQNGEYHLTSDTYLQTVLDTPDNTLEVARQVPGAQTLIMDGLGHFPMSEDYPRFRASLLPVLRAAAVAREALLDPRS